MKVKVKNTATNERRLWMNEESHYKLNDDKSNDSVYEHFNICNKNNTNLSIYAAVKKQLLEMRSRSNLTNKNIRSKNITTHTEAGKRTLANVKLKGQ